MKLHLKQSLKIIFGSFVLIYVVACSKDKAGTDIDQELFEQASKSEGFTWYKNSDEFLPKSAGTGHNFPKLRTRFNAVAAEMLDSIGKVKSCILFPEGSLIVKELINEDNSLGRYAILFKDSGSKFADDQGWVWGYVNSDKTVANSAREKGSSCISCHQQSGSIDYVLMNNFFP